MKWPEWAAAGLAAFLCAAGSVAIAPLAAQEIEPPKTLLPGKGAELTTARCALCHDVTHITRARLSRGEWEDNVRNMIERGAPIAPAEVPVILEYLAAYYNRDAPPPRTQDGAAEGPADPVQSLLAGNACIACHALDRKVVGPSFREIAERYRGDPAAASRLGEKIRTGGAGAWGAVPMPPHPQLSDSDLATLASWVLAR